MQVKANTTEGAQLSHPNTYTKTKNDRYSLRSYTRNLLGVRAHYTTLHCKETKGRGWGWEGGGSLLLTASPVSGLCLMSKVGVEHKPWTLHARFSHVKNTFLNISEDLLAQGVSTRSSPASSLTCHHLRDILEDLCVLLSVLARFLVLLTKCLKDHNKDISFHLTVIVSY